ncbi:MAG: hypothetical protein A3I60_05915 [Sulfuricurvum sp. RIFCSPLOWO2_02_FULL_43_45]|nr:MAG: hypothetical protein A3I60_05915 [Sulfuricurvum sp. RIFCSPLOWO2_02_FULL_43_45]
MKFQVIGFVLLLWSNIWSSEILHTKIQILNSNDYNISATCDFIYALEEKINNTLTNSPSKNIHFLRTSPNRYTKDEEISYYQYTTQDITIDFLKTNEKTIVYNAKFYNLSLTKSSLLSQLGIKVNISPSIEVGCDMIDLYLFFNSERLTAIEYSAYVD